MERDQDRISGMKQSVKETAQQLHGIRNVLEDLDQNVVRPIAHIRYGTLTPDTPLPPKMIAINAQRGCGCLALCSALVNELRRGGSRYRGNVYYEIREVTYLVWSYSRLDTADTISQIFSSAARSEFTVLVIPSFDLLFPAIADDGVANAARTAELKRALLEEITKIPLGKILVVACLSYGMPCDSDFAAKFERTYDLPYPDEYVRGEIISETLHASLMEISADLLDQVVRDTDGYTTTDLVTYIQNAIRKVERRRRFGTRRPSQTVEVIREDFPAINNGQRQRRTARLVTAAELLRQLEDEEGESFEDYD